MSSPEPQENSPGSGMEPVRVQMDFFGPGICEHNLVCWLCNERPAFYSGNPRWVFQPCRECQEAGKPYEPDAWWNVNEHWGHEPAELRWWHRLFTAIGIVATIIVISWMMDSAGL